MPRIAASIVFTASSSPLRNAVVVTGDDGTVLSVSRGNPSFEEMAGVQYYSGILVPGFADVMCGEAPDPGWLLSRGVRVAGAESLPAGLSGRQVISGKPGEPVRVDWQNRYGGQVGFLVYGSRENFDLLFGEGHGEGLLLWGGQDLPVLAGYGGRDLLQVMYSLQESGCCKLPELLTMASLNGALATGYGDTAGSIEPGKKSGLNIIEGADLHNMKLLPGSRLRRLV